MKKYLFLVLITGLISLSACSSDDDGETSQTDPIVGTWELTAVNPALINPQACDQASTITFEQGQNNTSGPANGTFYIDQNDCEPANSEGSWTNTGNSVYTIEVPFLGEQSGTVNFQDSNTFVFNTSGVSFTFNKQ